MLPKFASFEAKQRYFEAYDALERRWPVPFQDHYIETGYGVTHARVSGPADAPPLFLLHGFSATSLMWWPNVAAWSRHYRTYALDTIFDAGKSRLEHPLIGIGAHVGWLQALLDKMDISRANLLGISWGGFEATHFASAAPDRVDRLVLLAPVAPLKPIRLPMVFRLARAIINPSDGNLARMITPMYAPGYAPDPDFYTLITRGVATFRSAPGVIPWPMSDSALRRITAPTLLLVGEHEVFFNAAAGVTRATRLISNLEAHIVAGAGHFLSAEKPGEINEQVLRFLLGKTA